MLNQELLGEKLRNHRKNLGMTQEEAAEKIGVSYGTVTIRCQKTRWGSCSAKGNLNFNRLLADMPAWILDSVVAHELCHRKFMNHSRRFYSELKKAYPDYARRQKWLKENGSLYLQRAGKI